MLGGARIFPQRSAHWSCESQESSCRATGGDKPQLSGGTSLHRWVPARGAHVLTAAGAWMLESQWATVSDCAHDPLLLAPARGSMHLQSGPFATDVW